MRKIIALLLAALTLLSLGACSGNKDETARDLTAIYSQMETVLPEMSQLSQKKMLDMYGIRQEDCTEALVYVSSDGLLADEVWLIHAADQDALETLKAKAESRMQAKDDESVTYSPEQNKVVKDGRIIVDGLYLALLVTPDIQALVKAFG